MIVRVNGKLWRQDWPIHLHVLVSISNGIKSGIIWEYLFPSFIDHKIKSKLSKKARLSLLFWNFDGLIQQKNVESNFDSVFWSINDLLSDSNSAFTTQHSHSTPFYLALLLWYIGDMYLIFNNGSISIIGKDGGQLKQEITIVPFGVESVIPYLQWTKSTGYQVSIKHTLFFSKYIWQFFKLRTFINFFWSTNSPQLLSKYLILLMKIPVLPAYFWHGNK